VKALPRIWLTATAAAGTLDLLSAFMFSGTKGIRPLRVLQFVASGPLGDRAFDTSSFAVAGLITHYAIMACMVAAYMIAALKLPILARRPLQPGMIYGFGLWTVMYWIVRPLRWPDAPLPSPSGAIQIGEELISHVILVGIAIGLIVGRGIAARRA
jgi:hypothetical protein